MLFRTLLAVSALPCAAMAQTSCPADVLMALDADQGDHFGWSIDFDGTRAIVGAPKDDEGAPDGGAAYILDWDDTSGWTQTQKLVGADQFGYSVAIQGGRAVVGAPAFWGNEGTAYVFEFDGSTWNQAAQLKDDLIDGNETGDRMGEAVALDGDVVIVGIPWYDVFGIANELGAIDVFEAPFSGVETPVARLRTDISSQLGSSLAIEDDVIVAGAPGDSTSDFRAGMVAVFVQEEGFWATTSMADRILRASDPTVWAELGFSVDIYDGRVVTGSWRHDIGGVLIAGSVYVFDEPVGGWDGTGVITQPATIQASDFGGNHRFGASVALYGDRMLVGAPNATGAPLGQGAAYELTFDGLAWNEVQKHVSPLPLGGEYFGWSVDLVAGRRMIGRPNEFDTSVDAGLVYTLDDSCEPCAPGTLVGTPASFTLDRPTAVDGNTLAVAAMDASLGGERVIAVYERVALDWVYRARLRASDGEIRNVDVSGNTVVAGRYPCGGCTAGDGIFFFTRPPGGWVSMTETLAVGRPDGVGGFTPISSATVAIDGDVAMIGAGTNQAWILVAPPAGWVQGAVPAAYRLNQTHAGHGTYTVALDGDVAFVGAGAGFFDGTIDVFEKPGGGWADMSPTANLVATGGPIAVDVGIGASETFVVTTGNGPMHLFSAGSGGWASSTARAVDWSHNGEARVRVDGDRVAVTIPIFDEAHVFERRDNGIDASLAAVDVFDGVDIESATMIGDRVLVLGTDAGTAHDTGCVQFTGAPLNPPGSLSILDGTPHFGTTMTIGLHNPLDPPTQNPGTTLSFLFFTAAPPILGVPPHGGGLISPVAGMDPLVGGEILINIIGAPPFLLGPVWNGSQVTIDLPIPNLPQFEGIDFYLQGALYDTSGGPVELGMTEGFRITFLP